MTNFHDTFCKIKESFLENKLIGIGNLNKLLCNFNGNDFIFIKTFCFYLLKMRNNSEGKQTKTSSFITY